MIDFSILRKSHIVKNITYHHLNFSRSISIKPTYTPSHTPSKIENATVFLFESMYRRIGQGFCGSVWSPPTDPESTLAIKREDGGLARSVHNDYIMHRRILSTLAPSCTIRITACQEYISAEEASWWSPRILRFPKEFQVPCNALVTERIPPFPLAVREKLIDLYCSPSLKPSIKTSEPNTDCLIRPYIGQGRRSASHPLRPRAFSLGNYPLHMDQIEELGLDSMLLARTMAETLASIYWLAHIDANDIEFVLAPLPSDPNPSKHTISSRTLGDHALWILDFDSCKDMSFDETGVTQAVEAFFRNDPFFPRPGRDDVRDQELWQEFKMRFLEASRAIIKPGSLEARLPSLWADMVEKRGYATQHASE